MTNKNISDFINRNLLEGNFLNHDLISGHYMVFSTTSRQDIELCKQINSETEYPHFEILDKTLLEEFTPNQTQQCAQKNDLQDLKDCIIEDYIGYVPLVVDEFSKELIEAEEDVLVTLKEYCLSKQITLDEADGYNFTILFKMQNQTIPIQLTAIELTRLFLFFKTLEENEPNNMMIDTNFCPETTWYITKYNEKYILSIVNVDETDESFDRFEIIGCKEDFVTIFKNIFMKHINILLNL